MTQEDRRRWLIQALVDERSDMAGVHVPDDAQEQQDLLRALMNVRPPEPIGDEFLQVQDAYLAERLSQRGVVRLEDLAPVGQANASADLEAGLADRLDLWRG
ncbi:MAG: protein-ADP-ribose hydrolase, partial [Atopobiaceae bacterium]|nr:protein-ADP-ribose hydrolase [Atopobiaceae bacterium]